MTDERRAKKKEYLAGYRMKNKEKCNAASRAWRKANPLRAKENETRWYLKNKERILAASRAWRKANPLLAKERDTLRYLKNKEKYIAAARVWELANPEKIKAKRARYRDRHRAQQLIAKRKRKYGIDAEEQARLLANGCAICGEEATHIDHCHSTGKVRGGLCNLCNGGLGFFKDDPERLRAAARYLTKGETHT